MRACVSASSLSCRLDLAYSHRLDATVKGLKPFLSIIIIIPNRQPLTSLAMSGVLTSMAAPRPPPISNLPPPASLMAAPPPSDAVDTNGTQPPQPQGVLMERNISLEITFEGEPHSKYKGMYKDVKNEMETSSERELETFWR